MIACLLLLVLVALAGILVQLKEILLELRKQNDFSNEDAQVKTTTEQIRKAKERLPQQEN